MTKTRSDKNVENQSKAAANPLPRQLNAAGATFQPASEYGLMPGNELQEMANKSPQVKQLRALQAMANNYSAQTAQRKENKTGLPDTLKSGVETLSGYAMDDVKVHYNSDKPAQMQAHAYAQGSDIHVAPGQEQHLPHEAWHVVQQKQGRVRATMQLKNNGRVNPGAQVAQMVWVAKDDGSFYWSTLLNGLQWYFDQETDRFYFHIVDDLAVPMRIWNEIERLEGEMLTEGQLDRLGFQEVRDDASIVGERAEAVPADGMVSQTVAGLIMGNIQAGAPPFRTDLGLGGCSWFIWRGFGVPYTSIDKVKAGQEPKNVPIDAVVLLAEFPLVFDTAFLADRHQMYMNDPEFKASAEAAYRAHKRLGDKVFNRAERQALERYCTLLAEQRMWVSLGVMVNQHPTKTGVVSLNASAFSKSGNGKFLILADGTKIRIQGGAEAVQSAMEAAEKTGKSSAAASGEHD